MVVAWRGTLTVAVSTQADGLSKAAMLLNEQAALDAAEAPAVQCRDGQQRAPARWVRARVL